MSQAEIETKNLNSVYDFVKEKFAGLDQMGKYHLILSIPTNLLQSGLLPLKKFFHTHRVLTEVFVQNESNLQQATKDQLETIATVQNLVRETKLDFNNQESILLLLLEDLKSKEPQSQKIDKLNEVKRFILDLFSEPNSNYY